MVGMSTEHLLTSRDLAERLQMPRLRLERMARAGKLPAVVLPDGEIRFLDADVSRWVEEHRVQAAR